MLYPFEKKIMNTKFQIFATFFNKIRHIGFPVLDNVILTSYIERGDPKTLCIQGLVMIYSLFRFGNKKQKWVKKSVILGVNGLNKFFKRYIIINEDFRNIKKIELSIEKYNHISVYMTRCSIIYSEQQLSHNCGRAVSPQKIKPAVL